ncbi:acetate--CoA ligase family protein [Lutimonas sp.]|uniref:acetate--CoA ligase family protein n=1 Tax=Lutimonas sp. TaxID=1872403 RepID=UPI003D9AD89F
MMLHPKLINPESIAVIGGSDNTESIGGSVLKNLIDQEFKGELFVVNPKKDTVQDIICLHEVSALPDIDLAIIAIPAFDILEVVEQLVNNKETKAFIIFAAGFAELNEEGLKLQNKITQLITHAGASLLGPNNIGMINENYAGIFTKPIPRITKNGVDFISASGATAVFTIEAANQLGLSFSSLFTVGNSAQIGVEEVLQHMDESFIKGKSSTVKMLYIEGVQNPEKLLKHSISLKRKGCSILALKSGITEKGKSAASSHTGAMINSDIFITALFQKAGIIRCHSRHELVTCAALLQITDKKPRNFAIITHAGGPAVILTDTLSAKGICIPDLNDEHSDNIRQLLYPGASAKNPVDILATGNATQLEDVISYVENNIDDIDGMIVIFGSPGLGSVTEAFDVIHKKSSTSKKPIYAILPSVVNVRNEIQDFLAKGNCAFNDEYQFGTCLSKILNSGLASAVSIQSMNKGEAKIKALIDSFSDGFLNPSQVYELLTAASIKMAKQVLVKTESDLLTAARSFTYPVVQKVVGPLHKSDQQGVITSVLNITELTHNFRNLMKQKGVKAVLIQEMISGKEVFIGAKKEAGFPPLVLCGAGGIYIEALNDIRTGLVPIDRNEAKNMVDGLRINTILKGIRGEPGCHLEAFYQTIEKVSNLLIHTPQIVELDINPLMISANDIIAVDARIRIKK